MKFKKVLSVFTALLCFFSFASCGTTKWDASAQVNSEAGKDYGYSYDEIEKYSPAEVVDGDYSFSGMTSGETVSELSDNRKIVQTVSMSLETMQYEDAVTEINRLVNSFGGYHESAQSYGRSLYTSYRSERSASFTIRIPAERLDEFVNGFNTENELFNVTDKSENSQDITDTYYDTEARLNSLLTQEERLLAMLENATELQYMLQIEETLANVRYQIESSSRQIQRYDSQVSMSTVYINLIEVIKYNEYVEPPKTFLERIGIAFSNSWEDFVEGVQDFTIDIIYALPALILLIVFVVIIIIIVRRRIKRFAARKQNKIEAPETVINPEEDKKD